jgi:hypothetical protein
VLLAVGILYGEWQALLANLASALDPARLNSTYFWRLALAYCIPYTVVVLDRPADGLRL